MFSGSIIVWSILGTLAIFVLICIALSIRFIAYVNKALFHIKQESINQDDKRDNHDSGS